LPMALVVVAAAAVVVAVVAVAAAAAAAAAAAVQPLHTAKKPTANVVIRSNVFTTLANGICIGSEMSGGVSNVIAYDNHVKATGTALYFKSNLDRGAYIEVPLR